MRKRYYKTHKNNMYKYIQVEDAEGRATMEKKIVKK